MGIKVVPRASNACRFKFRSRLGNIYVHSVRQEGEDAGWSGVWSEIGIAVSIREIYSENSGIQTAEFGGNGLLVCPQHPSSHLYHPNTTCPYLIRR